MNSILYLDDEEPLAVLMKRLLERLGHRVVAFTRSEEALSAFKAAPASFDLVLSDLSMPGMSGIEFAQSVRAVRPDVFIVIATGHVQEQDLAHARAVGVQHVIEKSNDLADVARTAVRLLKESAALSPPADP